jgi:Protein of unknown function (DUF2877)
MKTASHDSPIELYHIGPAASRILSNPHQGSVLARLSNAVYLKSACGELCWLIPIGGSMHQRGMQIAVPLPRVNIGCSYEVVDHAIIIDSGEILNFHQTPIWRLPTVVTSDLVSQSRLSASLIAVMDQLIIKNNPSGFGCLIMPILQMTTHQNNAKVVIIKSRFSEIYWPAVQGMIQAYREKDANHLIDFVKSLIGFGEGLSPSGDDFLGGFFFSLQLMLQYYPNSMKMLDCNYSDIINQSNLLTNLISFTLLKDHVDGHSVEPLHKIANGLLLGEPIDQLINHAEKLISLGHSTGWDILTGFLAGISTTINQ